MKLLLPVVAVALLAGCGGASKPKVVQPHLPQTLAADWRAQADAVASALAAGDGCEAQRRAVALQTSVIAAVNAHRVAPRFQETLLGSVNDLASRIGCTPPPAPVSHGHGHPKPPKHHGHGKHRK